MSAPEVSPHDVLVIGESLIDVVRSPDSRMTEVVGGSPANVALGLGRLGDSPKLLTAVGDDPRGRSIVDHLERSGVTVDPASWTLDRTSIATTEMLAKNRVEYEFDIDWTLPASIDPGLARIVHIGSIAAFLEPGAHVITDLVERIDGAAMITFDPNIRPSLVGSRTTAAARVSHLASRATVVKLSDEDAAWLWPSRPVDQVVDDLIGNGTSLVVLTLGPDGAIAATRSARVQVPAPRVKVVDTVGAGDTIMASLIHCLRFHPCLAATSSPRALTDLLRFAVAAASLTVQRVGADLPTGADVRRIIDVE